MFSDEGEFEEVEFIDEAHDFENSTFPFSLAIPVKTIVLYEEWLVLLIYMSFRSPMQ